MTGVVLTGAGHVLSPPGQRAVCDPTPFLRVRKGRKFMGLQDDLALVAAGRALQSAGLYGTSLGERAGLYVAVGYLPFEEDDLASLADGSCVDGRFSPARFATEGYSRVHPLMTFRCLPNMPAYHVSYHCDLQGPYLVTYPGPGQYYQSLDEACVALCAGAIDVALVLGVTQQANFLVRHHWSREDPPVSADRLCDAAGCLVLETDGSARQRGAVTLASLAEYGITYDPDATPQESVEHEDRAPAMTGELGPASLAILLSLACRHPGSFRHVLSSRDGLQAHSRWSVR